MTLGRMRRARRWLAPIAVTVTGAGLLLGLSQAAAHPFGEPQTVRISAEGTQLVVQWIAPPDDLLALGSAIGAIPDRRTYTFDTSLDGEPEPVGTTDADLLIGSDELASYVADHIAVRQGGRACEADIALDRLVDDGARASFDCPQPVATVEIEITLLTDLNEAYRTVAIADSGAEPDRTLYATDQPVHTWAFDEPPDAAAGASSGTDGGPVEGPWWSQVEHSLTRAFDSGVVLPVALLIAFIVGAAHGLAPGHGKSLSVAYLVGSKARYGHALALAVIVALMHTTAVLALGLFWWLTVDSGPVPIEATTRWMRLMAALAVLAVGIVITHRRWRERTHAHHHHEHGSHTTGAPWSRAGLVGIASAGGLLPSPSAFVILVSGLLTGRTTTALAMVAMFGAGLAVTVLAVGLLTLAGRDWIGRRKSSRPRLTLAARHLPLVGAVTVFTGGCILSAVAMTGLLTT